MGQRHLAGGAAFGHFAQGVAGLRALDGPTLWLFLEEDMETIMKNMKEWGKTRPID